MTKLHQLKLKKDGADEAPPGPALPDTRSLQVTMSQETHVLLARLAALWLEKGARPSLATKSALVEEAIRALAKSEGLL